MILYGASVSPFVRKVLIVAAEKGIAIDSKNVGLGSADPVFREASPFGKIPALIDGDFKLADSTAIVTYLEAIHPAPALIPSEAKARAKTIWYDEFADTILSAAGGKIFFNMFIARLMGKEPDMAAAEAARTIELPPVLDYIERVMPERGFLVGDGMTLADIAVVSPFVNLRHCGIVPDAATHPKLARFVDGWLARPSLAALVARDEKMISSFG